MVRTYINAPDTRLEAVAISRPPLELPDSLPATWSAMPDLHELRMEWAVLHRWLAERCEVTVLSIADKTAFDATFIRDIAAVIGPYVLMTKSGVQHRSIEYEKACSAFLTAGLGRWPWNGGGYCEGADVLPVSKNTWYVGIGDRTDEHGADDVIQWASMQKRMKVHKVAKTGPSVPQHLLGGNRIIGGTLYTRSDIEPVPWDGPVVMLEPSVEIVERLSMNWLTLSESEVLLPDDCPEMKRLLEVNGITVYTLSMRQLRRMDGGFACSTLPLRRLRA